MATRFVTTGTLPSDTGANLTIGAGNARGVYYAVDRTAASPSSFLTDNVGGSGTTSATWNGQSLPTGCTWDTTTGTLNVGASAGNAWNPTAGNYVAIGKTVRISNGVRFTKAGAGSSGTNANIYFINCTIYITGTPLGWTAIVLGCFNDAGSSADRTGNYGIGATNGSMNAYGCDIIFVDTFSGASWALTDTVGCTISSPQGGTGAALPTICQGGRYVGSVIEFPRAAGRSDQGYQVYGLPAAFTGMTLDNVYFGNGGQWDNGGGSGSGYLIQSPNFTYLAQTLLCGVNVNNGNLPYQFTNTRIWATTSNGWWGNGGGSTYDGTNSIIGWGGGAGEWARGRDGLVHYQVCTPSFFSNLALTNAVANVRFRTYSNLPINTGGSVFSARFPSTAPTAGTYNLIGSFLSNTNGILQPESYSTDGSTFAAGNINMLTGQTSTAVNSTIWNTNVGGQSTPAGAPLLVAQITRTTASNTAFTAQYQARYTARSFTNTFDSTLFNVDYTAATVGQTLGNLSMAQVANQDPNLKARDVTAINATTTGNIDATFAGVFTSTATTADENDVYDALRYEWYRFNVANPPTLTATNAVDFGSANITINSAASSTNITARGYELSGNTWTFRCPYLATLANNVVNGGISTGGTINLVTQATTPGNYAKFVTTGTIALGAPVTYGSTVYQSLTANAISRLPTSGVFLGSTGKILSVATGAGLGIVSTGSLSTSGGTLTIDQQIIYLSDISHTLTYTGTTLAGNIQIQGNNATGPYRINLVNIVLSGNLSIGTDTGPVQVAFNNITYNGFTITLGTRVTQLTTITVSADVAGGLLSVYNGSTLVTSANIISTSQVINFTGAYTQIIWSQAGYLPLSAAYSLGQSSFNIVHTAIYPGWSAPATNLFTTSSASGVLTLTTTTGVANTPATAGILTAQSLAALYGTADFNAGCAYALAASNTLAQLISITDSASTILSTNLIQLRSSPASSQFFLGGITWVSPGTYSASVAYITGSTTVYQIVVISNAVVSAAGIIPAVQSAVAPMLTKMDVGVKDASLQIPYPGSTYP